MTYPVRVTIWGKDNCPNCSNAKFYCETQDIEFQYLKLEKDFTIEEMKEKFPEAKSFPVVQVNGTWVGGYRELISTHKNLTTGFDL